MSERVTDFWTEQMLKGNFEEAWKFSDKVLESRKNIPCWNLPRHEQYIWNGSSLVNKRVLIRCYHGLGDTIQFIRYAPHLKKIADEVIVWAQEPLIPLLKSMNGIDRTLPLHDGSPEVDYDVDVESMELPHIFRTTVASIPSEIPYLHVEPLSLFNRKQKPLVGLVWKVGNWAESRSVPFEFLKPLFELDNIEIIILQNDPLNAGWDERLGIYPGAFSLYDFARVIKGLDLVITPDSMPAHVAGSLGKPAWVLLQKHADWRWMSDRDDSPWYPTLKLFRQHTEGEWMSCIETVINNLKSFRMEP